MNTQDTNRWHKLFRDKGFYAALAVCLLALLTVGTVSLSRLSRSAEESPGEPTSTAAPTTTAAPVQNPVTGVPDLRTTVPATTAAPTTTATADMVQDLYVLPLSNEVCRPFSREPLYSPTMEDWRAHNGVDFVGKEGQVVKAAAGGTVQRLFKDSLWGDVVEINHGFGIVSRYCGVSPRNIGEGDTVKAGQAIGVLSAVPCEAADPVHLHIELLSSGQYLDAVQVIGVSVRYTQD